MQRQLTHLCNCVNFTSNLNVYDKHNILCSSKSKADMYIQVNQADIVLYKCQNLQLLHNVPYIVLLMIYKF